MAPHTVGGPVPVASRVGRDKQRYDGETGGRMVAGCVSKKKFRLSLSFFFLFRSRPRSPRSLSAHVAPLLFLLSPPPCLQKKNRTVPVRITGHDGGSGGESTAKLSAENVRVLLVTSRSGAGLVFPKGGWETDESCEAAAARETVEEAGVRGDLEPESLGTFRFASSKKQAPNGSGGEGEAEPRKSSAATMFALRVREELREWPESAQRCRVWLSPGDALAACKHAWMREALGAWAARHGIGSGGGGAASGGDGGREGARSDGANGIVSSVGGANAAGPSRPLEPSPGGRERAAAAAVEAARAAGLAVEPWITIAGEEGGGGEGRGEGTKPAKTK